MKKKELILDRKDIIQLHRLLIDLDMDIVSDKKWYLGFLNRIIEMRKS